MKNYYHILGVPEDAPLTEIKAAYRKLSKKFHPDANAGHKTFESLFRDVQEAYEVLSDQLKRAAHDYDLRHYREAQNQRKEKARQKEKIAQSYTGQRAYNKPRKRINKEVGTRPKQPVPARAPLRKEHAGVLAFVVIIIVAVLFFLPQKPSVVPVAVYDTLGQHTEMHNSFPENVSEPGELKDYWNKFNGSWSGSGSELNLNKTFTINLSFDFEKQNFLVSYPDMSFSGTWQLLETHHDKVLFKETVGKGVMNFTKAGIIEISALDDTTLAYKYYYADENNPIATSLLKKVP